MMSALLAACVQNPYEFETVKPLDEWYSETSAMGGSTYWNKIAYPLPPAGTIEVCRTGLEDGAIIDIYYPSAHESAKDLPVIIIARSFKSSEDFAVYGRSVLTQEYDLSWAHLLAAEGYAVVKYDTESPSNQLQAVISFLNENKKSLGISAEKIGLWSISANPSVVIQFLASDNEYLSGIRCSAFFAPVLKTGGAYSFDNLHHVPYFIAIGASDSAGINKTARDFAKKCKDAGLTYEFYEHPTGGHGFDALSAGADTEKIIKACLDFYNRNLK